MARKISMKPADAIATKYANSGSMANAQYVYAISHNSSWFGQATSDNAEANWQKGVTQAAAEKRRKAGLVNKTSQTAWQTNAINKGGSVLGNRIQAAKDKQAAGWKPYYDALTNITLEDKTPGDPIGNLTRNAGLVVKTLVNTKRSKEGAMLLP
jgi:hypothetical protein